MIIDTKPPFVQALLSPFRRLVTKPQFHHLWTIVLAWIVNPGRSDVLHLARCIPGHGHRTAIGRFLTAAAWDGAAMLDHEVQRILKGMRPTKGEAIDLIIDDTKIAKRARKMHAVGKLWIPTQKRFTYGHMVVTAAIAFRGVVMPWRFDLWVPPKQAGRRYRKSTQIAAAFIRAFQPPKGLTVRVLFDAFYLTPVVIRACEDRGFAWFSVASKNRTLTREKPRSRRRISDLAPGLLRYNGRNVCLPRARGCACFRVAMVDGRLKGIGPVRMVIRKRPRAPMTTATAIVTGKRSQTARQIAAIYERRWRIEELFKELRSGLGLGAYQVMSRSGILHHLHLCGLVHLVLTHHSLEAVGAQARMANRTVPLPTLTRRLEKTRQSIREHQIQRILSHERNTKRYAKLKQWLLAA